tara:strand:+ start:2937 stop:4256 length:1320 start_codon:yes stop_codon:yes gene_type:complete
MTLKNQGYRKDLNLSETITDNTAIDNLAGAGVANDIFYLQNNLRNTSKIPFNSVTDDGFFSFENDREIDINSIKSETETSEVDGSKLNSSKITVNLTNPYLLKDGDLVEITGITGNAEKLNGRYSVGTINQDLNKVTFTKPRLQLDEDNINVNNISFKLIALSIFVFTNGDLVTLSEDATFNTASGTITLDSSKNYYVIESNGINKFKLSTTENGTSVFSSETEVSGGTPSNFQFVRSDAVFQQQLINFIKPQIQDRQNFGYQDSVNDVFALTRTNIENAEITVLEKYRSDKSLTVPDSLKYEGSIVLNDPGNYNNSSDKILNKNVTGAPAPGIYIGGTRAFSSDNNPWTESDVKDGGETSRLETDSEQVSIGELAFLDGTNSMVIKGLSVISSTNPNGDIEEISNSDIQAQEFTHKIPIKVEDGSGNQETYFLLLSEN